jgi:hypothetical protein
MKLNKKLNFEFSLRKLVNYSGIYIAGVCISTAFVLYANDIFYNKVFRRLNNTSNNSTNDSIWNEIKPREIFGVGAKKTFIKNRIEDDMESEGRIYHNYIERKKLNPELDSSLHNNIYKK